MYINERERERERERENGWWKYPIYWHQISKEYSRIRQTMSVWLVIWSTILATFWDYNLSIVIQDMIKNDVRHFVLTKRFKFSIIWAMKSLYCIWWYRRHWIYEKRATTNSHDVVLLIFPINRIPILCSHGFYDAFIFIHDKIFSVQVVS